MKKLLSKYLTDFRWGLIIGFVIGYLTLLFTALTSGWLRNL